MHNFARERQSHWRKNSLPHNRYVATIPCESLRHKSNTFHTNISTLHIFISITFTKTSIDETNKTQQKVRGSKFMFKMSTIRANTCIQTTTLLRNRWWFRRQCPVLVLRSCMHFLEPGVKVNGDYYRNTVLLNLLLLDIRCFRGLLRFSAKWDTRTSCTWHCHHAAERDAIVYPSRDVAT